MGKISKYINNQLELMTHALNVVTGGDPKQCLSTRLWLNHPNSIARKGVDLLLGKDHCKLSAEHEPNDDAVIR